MIISGEELNNYFGKQKKPNERADHQAARQVVEQIERAYPARKEAEIREIDLSLSDNLSRGGGGRLDFTSYAKALSQRMRHWKGHPHQGASNRQSIL